MTRPLTDVRPCDACGGPVGTIFMVLRTSVAVLSVDAINEFTGMDRFFGGKASVPLVMNFAPAAHRALTIAMDEPEHRDLMTEIFLCMTCYVEDLSIAALVERVNSRREEAARVQSAVGRSTVTP